MIEHQAGGIACKRPHHDRGMHAPARPVSALSLSPGLPPALSRSHVVLGTIARTDGDVDEPAVAGSVEDRALSSGVAGRCR